MPLNMHLQPRQPSKNIMCWDPGTTGEDEMDARNDRLPLGYEPISF